MLTGIKGDVVGCIGDRHGISPSKIVSKVHNFSVGGGCGGLGEMG